MPSTSILDSLPAAAPTLGMTATQPPAATVQASQDQGPVPDLTVTVTAKRPAANTSVLDSLRPVAPTMGMQAANPDEATNWGAQLIGGIKQGIVGMANAPAALTGSAQAPIEAAAAAGGLKLPPAQPLFPGGFPMPQVAPAQTFPQRAANTVGQFLPSALLGAAGAESIPAAIGGVAKQIVPTVGAGIGAQAGQEFAPQGYGDVGQLAGATLGAGAGALAQMPLAVPARAIGNQVGQLGIGSKENIGGVNVTGAQARNAATQVGEALGPQGRQMLEAAPNNGQLVPGSNPTTAQVAPTPGARGLEKAHRVANQEPFIARDEAQNNARVQQIENVQPIGNPAAVGEHVVNLLDNIDKQGAAATQTALGRLQAASAALGGELPTEAYGGQIRGALQGALEPVHKATQELWNAVDPEGTWALPVGGFAKTAQSLLDDISPTGKTDPDELAILKRAAGTNGVIPFRDMSQMRSDINQVKAGLTGNPQWGPNIRRLNILKSSLDQTIADGANARAQAEETAVQSGQMAPEATITNRIGAFGSGGRSTGSTEQAAGGGTASVSGAGGTQREGSIGLGGRQGNSQMAAEAATAERPEPKLVPNTTTENVATYRAANAATREEKQRFGQGGVGQILRAGKNFQEFATPAGQVPSKILTGGPTELEEVNRLVNAIGNKDVAHNLMTEALANDLLNKGFLSPDGTINAGRYATWLNKHKATFDAHPEVGQKFRDAATAQGTYDKALADQKEGLAAFNKTAAARFINGDPHKAVGAAFSGTNPAEAMRSLVNAVKGNAEAEAGLKRAVVENILEMSRSAAPSGATRDFLNAGTFRKWIRQNGAPLKVLFGGQGLQNLEAVASDLRRQAYKTIATAGPDTTQKLLSVEKHGLREKGGHGNTVLAVLGGQIGELLGEHTGVGGIAGALAGAAAVGGGALYRSMRQAGIKSTNDLVREAMLHPKVAKELLTRLPAGKTSIGPLLARRIAATLQGLTAHELANKEQTQ